MIELRDYQVKFVRDVHDALRRCQRVIAVAPTGSGKRIILCWWATHIPPKGKRVAIVTDRRLLVNQARDECTKHNIRCGVIMGSEYRDDSAPVQICSIQTLKRRKWKDRPEADWWIIDEGHKESDAYGTIARLYPTSKIVGLTATPVGAQGKSLVNGALYEEMVEPVRNTELINQKWLVNTKVMAPSEPDIKGVSISNGEFNQTELGERVQQCTVFADVFKWWKPYSEMQTLCFAPRVAYAHGIRDQFERHGFSAAVIEAGTGQAERDEILESFATGSARVLCAVDVLREGFDCPVASCAIDLQPNKQLRTFWQKIGRVKRPADGKEHAIWLDFAGNFWRFPHPDDNPEWPDWTSGETTQDIIKRKRENKDDKQPWCCPSCSMAIAWWQKVKDGKCPNCGEPIRKAVKRIRMQDGQMKNVSAQEKKKKLQDADVQKWWELLYRLGYSGMRMSQARAIYERDRGKPIDPNKLPCCPKAGRDDIIWQKPIFQLFPQLDKRRR